MDKVLNIGIVGAGKIVESIHLPVLLNLPGVTVKWIFDKSSERMQLVSTMYAVKTISEEELDEALANIDICLIAVPYGVRDQYIRKCAALKRSIYVEKPFATTVAEHQMYTELFAEPDIAIGFQRRYYPMMADLQYIIKEKLFGEISAIHLKQGYFQLKGGGGFVSDARMSGGGVIIESAIHSLDQVLNFTGAKSVSVKEVSSVSKNGIDYDTKFTSTISCYEHSFDIYSHISCLQNLDNGISIEFEKAVLQFQPTIDTKFYINEGGVTKEFDTTVLKVNSTLPCNTVNASFIQFWKEFIEGIHNRQPNKTNASSSLITSSWIEQIYRGINNSEV